MTNTLELKSAIMSAGLTIRDVARAIGLSEYGFHKKLHNLSEFKASEIIALSELLHLDCSRRDKIFFAKM